VTPYKTSSGLHSQSHYMACNSLPQSIHCMSLHAEFILEKKGLPMQ